MLSIHVPESLAEIRAYVRWKNSESRKTTAEWQAEEYKKPFGFEIGLALWMTLNDIRRRYDVEPVEGDDEIPMFTMDGELEKRMNWQKR